MKGWGGGGDGGGRVKGWREMADTLIERGC